MNTEAPTKPTNSDGVWLVYGVAMIFLLPAFVVWLFTSIFLFPRLEMIWHQAGLDHSHAQWLLDVSRHFKDNGRWLIALVIILFAVLETRWHGWPRYRRRVILCTVFILNSAVLFGITILCISAFLAIPLMAEPN